MEYSGFGDFMSLLGGDIDLGYSESSNGSPGSVISSCSDASLHEFDVPASNGSVDDLVSSLGLPFLRQLSGGSSSDTSAELFDSSENCGLTSQWSSFAPDPATSATVAEPSTSKTSTESRERDHDAEKPVRLRMPVSNESARERNLRNALAARENRRKKKSERETLEGKVKDLSGENATLKAQVAPLRSRITELEDEVSYLRNVLHNESSLARLLGNIPVSNVRLRSSRGRKRPSTDADRCQPDEKRTKTGEGSGVCLHVCNDKVSLEFCKECSRNAD